eukprot:TRINITY_DN5840_c0_g1_i5.p1 TRINITY_DN5840_c0_g1~~TRINITY_DN5840_c0_g1_i5.p1  ORF type:complete len:171 (+),score=22.67 TRINITY_DN5840_c0_g1_i5:316-828(+)
MIERFPKLKVIANHGAGYNHIDAKYAAMKGILVTNTPGVVGPATADVAMAHLLNITRRFSESERWLRREKTTQGGWTMFMSHSPEGKRMGIFGLGSIGKQVAKRARAFDMVVQYHNRYSPFSLFHFCFFPLPLPLFPLPYYTHSYQEQGPRGYRERVRCDLRGQGNTLED